MNPLAWILDSIKVHPEPVSIPDVSELTPVELAEIRSRLQTFAQVARELTKLVDVELAGALQGSALNYGGQIIRASNGRGSAKVVDERMWWILVVDGLKAAPNPPALLGAMFPASSVRLTALPKLEAALGLEDGQVKSEFIRYDPPTSLISVMPLDRAPKYLQDLAEGEIR